MLKGKEEESTMCDELNFRTVRFERKMKESRKKDERLREKNSFPLKNTLAKNILNKYLPKKLLDLLKEKWKKIERNVKEIFTDLARFLSIILGLGQRLGLQPKY